MTDHTYRLAISYAQAVNLDFWEVIFRRACHEGNFEIGIADFESLYCTRTVDNYIKQALLDNGPLTRNHGGGYSLKNGMPVNDGTQRHLCIEKPVSYIDNDVYVALGKSLQPKRLINCLLYERAREIEFPSFVDLSKDLARRPFVFTYAELKRRVDLFIGKGVNSNEFPEAVNWLAQPRFSILKIEEPSAFPFVRYDVPIVFKLNTDNLSALPYISDPPLEMAFELILDGMRDLLWKHYQNLVGLYGKEGVYKRVIGPLVLYPMAVKASQLLIGRNGFFKKRTNLEWDLFWFMRKLVEQMNQDGFLTITEMRGEGENLSVFVKFNEKSTLLCDVNNFAKPSDKRHDCSISKDDFAVSQGESTYKKARREYWFSSRERPLKAQMTHAFMRDPQRAAMVVYIGARLHFTEMMCHEMFAAIGKWYDRVPPDKYDSFKEFAVGWGIENKGAFSSKKLIDAYCSQQEMPRWTLSISYANLSAVSKSIKLILHTPKSLADIEAARIERVFQLKELEVVDTENLFVETIITDNKKNMIFSDRQPVYGIAKDYITPYPDITDKMKNAVPPLTVTFRISRPEPQLQIFVRIQYRLKETDI